MVGETILVVDDNFDMRDILQRAILKPLGYNVITAKDGLSGLQMAVERTPDLILLDMNLPLMNGLELLERLRKMKNTSPVIFMTLHGSEHIAVEAFRLGVRDYLEKPFTAEEVETAINKALRETRLYREREVLDHDLTTAETVRMTVVTLSHYLNNYLMALGGGLALLEETLLGELPDPEALKMLTDCQGSVRSIEAVLKILLRTTNIRPVNYSHTTPILDIEAELAKEMGK